MLLSIPSENRSGLRSRNRDNNQGLCFGQVFGNVEVEPGKAALIELTVEQVMFVQAVYFFLQGLQAIDGDYSCLIAVFSQPYEQFVDDSIHSLRRALAF
jgi:hypothetical protein